MAATPPDCPLFFYLICIFSLHLFLLCVSLFQEPLRSLMARISAGTLWQSGARRLIPSKNKKYPKKVPHLSDLEVLLHERETYAYPALVQFVLCISAFSMLFSKDVLMKCCTYESGRLDFSERNRWRSSLICNVACSMKERSDTVHNHRSIS